MLSTSKKPSSASSKPKLWSPYAPWGLLPVKSLSNSVDFEYDEYASPIKKIFLPPDLISLERLKEKRVIVRDGLITVLDFFDKNPKPPPRLFPELFFHETWASFVPEVWRSRCGLYRTVRSVEKSLLKSNQSNSLSRRKTWVTYFRFNPHFSGARHLQARLSLYGRDEKMNCIGFFETGHGSCNYQLQAHHFLNNFLQTLPENYPAYQLVHSTQMNSCQILDLNERLLCSDDAASHLFHARGGLDPLQKSFEPRAEELVRLSQFHGYALRPISRKSWNHWEKGELKKLVKFFKEKVGPRWNEEIALNQFELFDQ